jgi:hypothetical protein
MQSRELLLYGLGLSRRFAGLYHLHWLGGNLGARRACATALDRFIGHCGRRRATAAGFHHLQASITGQLVGEGL